jgi:hypothetical protein
VISGAYPVAAGHGQVILYEDAEEAEAVEVVEVTEKIAGDFRVLSSHWALYFVP